MESRGLLRRFIQAKKTANMCSEWPGLRQELEYQCSFHVGEVEHQRYRGYGPRKVQLGDSSEEGEG